MNVSHYRKFSLFFSPVKSRRCFILIVDSVSPNPFSFRCIIENCTLRGTIPVGFIRISNELWGMLHIAFKQRERETMAPYREGLYRITTITF